LDEPPSYFSSDILSGSNLLYILVTVVLLFVAGLLSASEGAFFSLTPEEVESLQKSKRKNEQQLASILGSPRLLLAVITAWKYVALLSCALLFALAITLTKQNMLGEALVLAITFAFIGIIIPKVYGTFHKKLVSLTLTPLYYRLVKITKPFVSPLLNVSFKVEKKLEQLAEESSVRELTQALELAAADKTTTEDQREILKGIVNFGTLTVEEVMRPVNEIHSTDLSLNFHDLLIYIKKSGFSRLPVYRSNSDQIEGILYIKDLLPYLNETKKFNWQKLLRPVYFVPESKKIDLLLKDFQEKRVHMALALNNDGKVSGIITLEDIIEEIIGDIHDEFDEEGAYYKKIDDKTFVFDSKISVPEFCRILDVDPEIFAGIERGENETLGRVLLEMQNELPKIGDQILADPVTFVIEAVDHKRIKRIKVHLHEQEEK
jgi:putative hemolysin